MFADLLAALQGKEVTNVRVPRITDTIYNADDGSSAFEFARGISAVNREAFETLAAQLNFANVTTVADIGGSIGQFSAELAASHSHLQCTTYDLPFMVPLARQHLAALGLSERVSAASIDFLNDPFPSADMIIMSMVGSIAFCSLAVFLPTKSAVAVSIMVACGHFTLLPKGSAQLEP